MSKADNRQRFAAAPEEFVFTRRPVGDAAREEEGRRERARREAQGGDGQAPGDGGHPARRPGPLIPTPTVSGVRPAPHCFWVANRQSSDIMNPVRAQDLTRPEFTCGARANGTLYLYYAREPRPSARLYLLSAWANVNQQMSGII